MNDSVKKDNDQVVQTTVPFLPTDLPFNEDQKQWVGGFLAGLHTKLAMVSEVGGQQAQQAEAPKPPLTILFGSQTGNAESVAEDTAELAKSQGLAPQIIDMDDMDVNALPAIERLLVVTSTYGEGEMPDNAQALWDAVSSDDAPQLNNTFFSVLALGDTNYDGFCLAGKEWDERLAALGAQRIGDRVDCDVDFAALAEGWMNAVVPTIASKGSQSGGAPVTTTASESKKAKSKYNRNNPLTATLLKKRVLNQEGSSKEVVHYEFSLAGSGESYNAGDALNIIPVNRGDLVDELVALLGDDADAAISWQGESSTLKTLLTDSLEIRTPSKELIQALAVGSKDAELNRLLENADKEALDTFLYGKDCVDLIKAYPCGMTAQQFCDLSKPLAPRAYSISSSINQHAEEVHLTIASVRYKQADRPHNGVCSTFLADIAEEGETVKCYFSPNKNFAVPENNDLPIIMVGPGTGIAPFRAFLEERQAREAKGDNWLFFGDRNGKTDFLYQDEVEAMQSSGLLTKLDLAFSRDQKEKIYVQDRMIENGESLFNWLESGAYFYVCGDAYRMAKDVDKALHQVIATHGNMDEAQAEAYVADLKKLKRYVRDVY